MLSRLKLCIAILIFPQLCLAFSLFPEFHTLTENEAVRLDQINLIDAEYQSDVVTYLTPPHWSASFHGAGDALDLSLGSLSSQLFLHYTRLKLSEPLTSNLTFRFTYFQQRDLDTEQTHAVLELVQKLSSTFSISAYGEPSLFKRENDIGLALITKPSEKHEIRLFHTWVDFTRQEHNDRSDFYVRGSEPTTVGFVGRCSDCFKSNAAETDLRPDANWLEYFLRWEKPTKWRFPDLDSEYRYEFFTLGGSSRFSAFQPQDQDRGLIFNLRLEASRKREGFLPLSGSSPVAAEAMTRELFESLGSVELPPFFLFNRPLVFEPGLGWFHREWNRNGGQQIIHRNVLPFAWLKFFLNEGEDGLRDTVELGYEATFFDADGDFSLGAPELLAWSAEHRLNFRYSFYFKTGAVLSLAATFDPDAAIGGSGGTFEGGNGQFRTFF